MKPIRRTPAPDLLFRRIATRYDKLTRNSLSVTQPPDPGRLFGDSVRLSFWLGVGGQGPLSGALA